MKLTLLALLLSLFTGASAFAAGSRPVLVAPRFYEMLRATSIMGLYYQTALACGLPDSQTQGIRRAHAANKALLAAYQNLASVPARLKKAAGNPARLDVVFEAGRRQRLQQGTPSTAECSRLKAYWPRYDQGYLALAQRTYLNLTELQTADRARAPASTTAP